MTEKDKWEAMFMADCNGKVSTQFEEVKQKWNQKLTVFLI